MKPAKTKPARMTGAPAKPVRRRRGLLWRLGLQGVIGLFLFSGLLRIGEAAWMALATTGNHAPAVPAVMADGAQCPTPEGVLAMLSELQAREKNLRDREAIQAERDQAMRQAERRLEERLAELVATEEKLARTMSIADTAAEQDVSHLVALYENMKPKEAAPLFEEMAPDFAAGFLARMRPDAAAALLASLNPKTGYTISVLMAGRNANAPKD